MHIVYQLMSSPWLQYTEVAGNDPHILKMRFDIFRALANACGTHESVRKWETMIPFGVQWVKKSAIYRQHALAVLKKMGRGVPSKCSICRASISTDMSADWLNLYAVVFVNECGHLMHTACVERRAHLGLQCPSCA